MNGLTEEEKINALLYLNNGAEFMLMPTKELCEKIINKVPETNGLNSSLLSFILEKKAIRLDNSMIKKYCTNKLDKKNKWLLDNSNIKVIPSQFL